MRVTMNNVNKAIADLGYELIKGDGYFYFWALEITTPELYEQSVYTNHLGAHTVEGWRDTLVDRIKESKKYD